MKWNELSKKNKAIVVASGLLLLIMLWAFISAGILTRNFNKNNMFKNAAGQQDAYINGIILTETKDKTKYWELYGETGTYDSNNEVAMMDNVVGNFYKDNSVAMSFQSSKGAYNSNKNLIVLYNDTFIVLKNETTLKADQLIYSGSEKPIIAKGNVIVTKGHDFLASADMIEINPNFEDFKITGKTTTKIYKGK